MASSNDFKEQLKAGKILDALTIALSQAVELEITTWVASSSETDSAKRSDRLRTRINMLEGSIENEIGNQFIGNSPYKELRQFHQEQVTESSKIIQNNLNSLQKLFGILVKIRHPNFDSHPVEPELSSGSQTLPPAKNEQSPIESPHSSPQDTVEPPVNAPSLETSNLEDEDLRDWLEQEPQIPVTPTPNLEASNVEMEEGWGDLVVEEPSSTPSLEASNLDMKEGWGDLDVNEPSPAITTSSQSSLNLGLDLGMDADWGDLEAPLASLETPTPSLEFSNLENENWNELSSATLAPSLELSNLENENWNELSSATPAPSLELSNLENENRDELSSTTPDASISNLETEADWEEFEVEEVEPLTETPTSEGLAAGWETEEDWEEFDVEEVELPEMLVSEGLAAGLDIGGDWEDSDIKELETLVRDVTDDDLMMETGEDWEEFDSQELEPYPVNSDTLTETPAFESLESMGTAEDWEGFDVDELETFPAKSETTSTAESLNVEDDLFADASFEELSPMRSQNNSDPLAAFEEDYPFTDLAPPQQMPPLPPPPLPNNQLKNKTNQEQEGK